MKKILFLLLLGAALSARAGEPFVGMYRQDDADITARLLLLDKQRFCFAISAGGIDMHTGGSWQKMDGQNGSIRLRLTEKHLGLPALVMVANPEMDAKTLAKTLAETQQMFGKEKRVVFWHRWFCRTPSTSIPHWHSAQRRVGRAKARLSRCLPKGRALKEMSKCRCPTIRATCLCARKTVRRYSVLRLAKASMCG